MLERWRRCVETGEDWDDEHHVLGPNGVYHTVLTRGRPVRDRNGAIVAWVGINLDIDDREEAERALAESEEKYRSLVDLSPDAVVVHRRRTILYANPAAARLLRAEPGALAGASILDLVHPDDRAVALGRLATVQNRGEATPLREFRLLIDGTVIDTEAVGGPVRWEGGPAVQVVIREISERKRAEEALRESEERYRALIAASSQVLYRMGPDWSEMRELRGGGFLADTERPNPDWVQGYIHPDDRPRVLAAIADAVRTRTVFDLEHRVLRADGTLGWTQSRAVPVRDAAGKVVEWFGAASDITARKEAEAERTRYAGKLARSNKELQRFAYTASHDQQEPMRSIVSFSQLLARRYRGKLDTDADKFIAFIVEGGNRMQRLITDLLQLSQVETMAKPLEPTDADEVVADALRVMETAIGEAGATVTVGPMPRVMADATQLTQVLMNLVGNALKYRSPGELPEVTISARRLDGMIESSIADNGIGIGIEAEYFGRIFVIFQRLHTREEYEGTGIGLAVVRKIFERHGGRIRVESIPGEGSTFSFTLPAA